MNPLTTEKLNLVAVQTAEALLLGELGELTPHMMKIHDPVIIQIVPSPTGQGADIRLIDVFLSPRTMSIHGGFSIIRIEDASPKIREVLSASYESFQIQRRSGLVIAKG